MKREELQTPLSHHANIAPSFRVRGMAFLIDLSIVTQLSFLIFLLTTIWLRTFYFENIVFAMKAYTSYVFLLFLCPLALSMIYSIIFHARNGQTVGKMFMNIRVVSADGGHVTLGAAFLRWVGYFVSAFPLGVGFFWPLLDKSDCSWHDKLAGTHVVAQERT